jgi:hypothetical protein
MFNLLKNTKLILIAIILLGFLVRLYKIDNPVADWHSWRQADTASVTRNYVEDGIDILYPKYQDLSFLQTGIDNPEGYRYVEFPIYNVFHTVLVKVFPFFNLDIWGRLLSVFCSIISIYLMYLIGRRFLGEWGGVASAFFFAFMPFNIYFSRVILPEPMAVMFALSAVVAFYSWIDRQRTSHLIISAVLFCLALLVKPHALFLAAVPMSWLALQKYGFEKTIKEKRLWLYLAIVLIPLFVWRIWEGRHPEGIPHYSWMFNADALRFKPAFWRWLFGDRIGRMMLGGWGLAFFVLGLVTKTTKREQYMAWAFFMGAFLYMSVIAAANIRHDYYQTFVVPAVCFILAKGILFFWQNPLFDRFLSRIVLVACLIFMLGFSWYDIKELYKINHPEIVEAGKILDQVAPKDAKVLAPYNGDTALLYQTHRSGWPYLTYAIEEMIQKRGAQYYVSVNPKNSETQDAIRKFIIIAQTDRYVVLKLEPKPAQP